MKWEYRSYILKEDEDKMNKKFDEKVMNEIMDKYGKIGFELVNVVGTQRSTSETSKLIFFFKRQLVE